MYHWISSQPFELSLKIYRLAAFPALISAASKTIQFASTANLVLNQSIPRLSKSRIFTPPPHGGLGNFPGPPTRPPDLGLQTGRAKPATLIRCSYKASMENLVERRPKQPLSPDIIRRKETKTLCFRILANAHIKRA